MNAFLCYWGMQCIPTTRPILRENKGMRIAFHVGEKMLLKYVFAPGSSKESLLIYNGVYQASMTITQTQFSLPLREGGGISSIFTHFQ